ncbi:helix-turn-helix transcriptional regulator [Vulgatibacter sp.]|uniref:helix-turn-helix transcriptional regulator n=1 Tax=Vulgatibacter sp. TaxID=1971226 RepID=UPI00356928C3
MFRPTEREAATGTPIPGPEAQQNVALSTALEAGPSSPRAVAERVASAAACDVVVAADLDAPFIGPTSVYGRGLADEAAWRTAIRVAAQVANAAPRSRGDSWAGSLAELSGGRGDTAILGGARAVLVILRSEGGRPRTLVVAARREGEFGDAERRAMTAAAARPEPRDPVIVAALEAVASRTGVPLGLLHAGKLMWAAGPLWRALGLEGGARLGRAFAHGGAPAAAGRLEDAARTTGPGADLDITSLPGELQLLQATRPADVARSARLDELGRRWRLSPAERAELQHLMLGLSCKEAAARLGVSPETIRGRRKQIYRKARVGGAGPLRALLDGVTDDEDALGGTNTAVSA